MSNTSLKTTDTTHLWMVWYRAPTPGSLKSWAFLLTLSSDETASGTAYQAEGYDDASDAGSSASSLGETASGSGGDGSSSDGGQYFMTVTPDVPLRMSTLSARGTFAQGHIYLGALSATDSVTYFRDCCETGIDVLNMHNKTHADAPPSCGPAAPETQPHTHQDWVLDIVGALEDVAIVQPGTVAIVKACPRRGW